MRLVRYVSADGTGIGAVLGDGRTVATPWRRFEDLFTD